MENRTCNECGTPTIHKNGFYYKKDNMKVQMSYKNLCGDCLKKLISTLPHVVETCQHCGKTKFGIGYTNLGHSIITLCNMWWNQGHNCLDCIYDVIDNGEPATDVYVNSRIQYLENGTIIIFSGDAVYN